MHHLFAPAASNKYVEKGWSNTFQGVYWNLFWWGIALFVSQKTGWRVGPTGVRHRRAPRLSFLKYNQVKVHEKLEYWMYFLAMVVAFRHDTYQEWGAINYFPTQFLSLFANSIYLKSFKNEKFSRLLESTFGLAEQYCSKGSNGLICSLTKHSYFHAPAFLQNIQPFIFIKKIIEIISLLK